MHSDSQKVTVNLILDGIARKPLIGELRSKRQCRKVLFISANTLGVEGTNTKALKLFGTLTTETGVRTQPFCCC